MNAIYLVDDHALVRDGLRAVLEDAGHRVVGEAEAPAPALDALRRLEPEIVLLDLKLGSHSGFELLETLQQRALPTRAIVVTMSEQPRDVAEALRLGAAGYVLKGTPAREVLAAVNTVAAGGQHLGARVARLAQHIGADEHSAALEALSARERQVLRLVVRGATSAAIGEKLHLSPKTVDSYRSRMMTKLGVADLPALVRLAIREGLIGVEDEA
jgi:two-component system, NarL family, invasion response regulator UvrY